MNLTANERMKRIAIDIGHANGTGARGNGFDEHAQCARLAAELKKALEKFKLSTFSADIVDFPEQSNSSDLAATVKAVNAGEYDACVSLHMDASDNPSAHGAHVCYYSERGQRMASEIASRLCPQLPGRANQTVKRTDLYVLKKTRPVAVLVECGFITNEGDAHWVYNNPDKVALPIALGIAAYFDYES